MNNDLFKKVEASKFRADEEDVFAYVHSILQEANKEDILLWIHDLPKEDLYLLITPYLTEKLTEEITTKELEFDS